MVALSVVATPLALFGILHKSKTHFIGVEYRDDAGQPGAVLLEADKNNYRAILKVLEAVTGQAGEERAVTELFIILAVAPYVLGALAFSALAVSYWRGSRALARRRPHRLHRRLRRRLPAEPRPGARRAASLRRPRPGRRDRPAPAAAAAPDVVRTAMGARRGLRGGSRAAPVAAHFVDGLDSAGAVVLALVAAGGLAAQWKSSPRRSAAGTSYSSP